MSRRPDAGDQVGPTTGQRERTQKQGNGLMTSALVQPTANHSTTHNTSALCNYSESLLFEQMLHLIAGINVYLSCAFVYQSCCMRFISFCPETNQCTYIFVKIVHFSFKGRKCVALYEAE